MFDHLISLLVIAFFIMIEIIQFKAKGTQYFTNWTNLTDIGLYATYIVYAFFRITLLNSHCDLIKNAQAGEAKECSFLPTNMAKYGADWDMEIRYVFYTAILHVVLLLLTLIKIFQLM